MKFINAITSLLVIIGGVNWGLFGAFNLDLVAAIFGPGSMMARIVYILVCVSAIYQLIPFSQALSTNEVAAESGIAGHR